jgi:hypothetical protein
MAGIKRSVIRKISNPGKTAAFTFNLPANCFITDIAIINNTSNAVTGGLKFGTTLGGNNIINTVAVLADDYTWVDDDDYIYRIWDKAADQTIYVDAVTAWNSANLDVTILIAKL